MEQSDGTTIRWGRAEKWIVGGFTSLLTLLVGALVAVLTSFGSTVVTRLDKQGETLNAVERQQAVQSGQMQTLTTQLADVPRLTREMAEIKVRVDRHEQDIRDLGRNRRPQQ